jgi:glutathione peroxidase
MNLFARPLTALDGTDLPSDVTTGKVVLLVNVASQCGLTPQYTGLEALQQRFEADGFTVLGAPCNQFGAQEPGSAQEIQTFCSMTYGTSFPMLEKLDVNGASRHPLYADATSTADAEGEAGDVQWNFEKFLVGRDGTVVGRFRPTVEPESGAVVEAIQAALASS